MERVPVLSAAMFDLLPPCMGFISARFHLSADVDGALLQRAVDDCLMLYPVFGWHIEREGGAVYLAEGPGAVPVYQGKCLLLPAEDDAEYPLVTVGYYKNILFFAANHRLCDGQGASLFFGGILTRYSALQGGSAEPVTGPAYDLQLMLRQTPAVPVSVPEGYTPTDRVEDPFLFPMTFDATRCTSKVFAVNEEAFIRYVKAEGSNPTAAIQWLAAKGLYRMHPTLRKEITGSFIINTRSLTGLEQSVANSLGYGRVTVSCEEVGQPGIMKTLKEAVHRQMEPDRLRWYILHPDKVRTDPATFIISYMRDTSDWNGLVRDHIALYFAPVPSLEVRALGGRFEFMVDFSGDENELYDALKLAVEEEGFRVFDERSTTTETDGRFLHFSDI